MINKTKTKTKTKTFPALGKIMSIAGLASIPFVIFSTPVFAIGLSFTGGSVEFTDFSTGGLLVAQSAINNNTGTVIDGINLTISYVDDNGIPVPALNRAINVTFSPVDPGGTYQFPGIGTVIYNNSAIVNAGFIPNADNLRVSGNWTYQGQNVPGAPWETDSLPVVGSTVIFGLGLWSKQKLAQRRKDKKD